MNIYNPSRTCVPISALRSPPGMFKTVEYFISIYYVCANISIEISTRDVQNNWVFLKHLLRVCQYQH
jgi:hypothetical protein